jgi:trehalose 6-phosphate synthase/phosphatase
MRKQRLFIVASRLPVCIDSGKENPIRPASSKLVTAIKTYLQGHDSLFTDLFWVGIPGCRPTRWNEATNRFFESPFTYLPVLVFKEQYRHYHQGFAKSVIWPLFHGSASHAFNQEEYEQYISVNERYAEILEKKCWEKDIIWINDYHLLPLSGMIRNKFPEMRIEFFLHIPFPSFELFLLLPENCQAEILKGMIGADVIRFHTRDDIINFSGALEIVFGYNTSNNSFQHNDRLIKIDLFSGKPETKQSSEN